MNSSKIKTAIFWTSIEAVVNIVLSIASLVFIARILTPKEYGYIATAQFISLIIQLVLSMGLSEAIIQKKNLNDIDISSAFIGTVILSIIGGLVCAGVAEVFYFNEFIVRKILLLEIFNILIATLLIVPSALLIKNLKMKSFTRRTLFSRVVFIVVACFLIKSDYGFWSIVYASLAQNVVSLILILFDAKKLMTIKQFNKDSFINLFKFGIFVMLENLLWSALNKIFGILISIFHGAAALGIYSMATKLTDSILGILHTIITKISLPIFSSVQDDRDKLLNFFQNITFSFNIISMVFFSCFAITAGSWIPILLGAKWLVMKEAVQIISIMIAIMFSRRFSGVVVNALGRSKEYLYLSFTAALISLFAVFLTKDYTLEITLLALAIPRIIITIPLGIYLLYKIAGFSFEEQIQPLKYPILGAFLISGMVYIFQKIIIFDNQTLSFLIQVFAGILFYLIFIFYLYKFNKFDFKGNGL